MSHFNNVSRVVLAAVLGGCASAPTAPTSTLSPPSTRDAAEQLCSGVSEGERNLNLCLDSEEIVRAERMPVASRGGNVLTGARVVFRPSSGRTAESFQHVVACQMARNSGADSQARYPQVAYCPLAVKGVAASVRPVADGLAVEIKPKDARSSHSLFHTMAHGTTALQLARFESAACRGIEPKARGACPLLGPVTVISDLPGGVRVEFAATVSVDSVLAGMRCHYSFAEARGFSEEAAACPLYIRGLHLERSTDGKAIDITITPAALVNEVRKRVREEAVFANELRGGA